MRCVQRALISAFGVLSFVVAAQGSGVLVPSDGSPPIAVQSQRVTIAFDDGLARTTVRQTFVNPNARTLEAIYTFPVPESAAMVGLTLEVAGQRMEGVLADRRTARRTYRKLVERAIDPALLEQLDRAKFRLSVFPVAPNVPTVVELTWIDVVPLRDGVFRYVYPLADSSTPSTTTHDFTLQLDATSSATIHAIDCDLEGTSTTLVDAHRARASFERTGVTLNRDVSITIGVGSELPSVRLRVFRPTSGDPYFAAIVTPPPLSAAAVIPRDVTVLIDVSGSMRGEKIEQAKAAAHAVLDTLGSRDRARVVTFSDVLTRSGDLARATPEHLAALRAFVDAARDDGGTALGDAIVEACATPTEPGRSPLVVALTDGIPTIGEQRPEAIVDAAARAGERGARVFTFGVGDDVDAALLDGVAAATGAASEILRLHGEIRSRIASFAARTRAPAMTQLRVSIDGKPVDDVLPRPSCDLHFGEQAIVVGRAPMPAGALFAVTARWADSTWSFTTPIDVDAATSPTTSGASMQDPVARDLYAKLRLTFLERGQQLRSKLSDVAYWAAVGRGAYSTDDELVRAMIDTSLEVGVQCAHTSFLALLPEDRTHVDPRDAAALELAAQRAAARRAELAGVPTPSSADCKTASTPTLVDEGLHDEPNPPLSADVFGDASEILGVGGGGGSGGKYYQRGAGIGSSRKIGAKVGTRKRPRPPLASKSIGAWITERRIPESGWSADLTNSATSIPDVGVTAVMVHTLLTAGNTPNTGPHAEAVRAGVQALIAAQGPDGAFAMPNSTNPVRDQALATWALVDAFIYSREETIQGPARRAIARLEDVMRSHVAPAGSARGGRAAEPLDFATIGFGVLALQAGSDIELGEAPYLRRTLADAIEAWVGSDAATLAPRDAAIVLVCRVYSGQPADDARAIELTKRIEEFRMQDAARAADYEAWPFVALATLNTSASTSEEWRKEAKQVLAQWSGTADRSAPPFDPSWDPRAASNPGLAVAFAAWSCAAIR